MPPRRTVLTRIHRTPQTGLTNTVSYPISFNNVMSMAEEVTPATQNFFSRFKNWKVGVVRAHFSTKIKEKDDVHQSLHGMRAYHFNEMW